MRKFDNSFENDLVIIVVIVIVDLVVIFDSYQ
jgi:hypothetical protein